jgi:3-dehydroquinate synthase
MAVTAPDVVLGPGALKGPVLPDRPDRRRVAVVTHRGAVAIARGLCQGLAAGGMTAELIEVPDGEAAKSIEVATDVYRRLNRMGMTRADTVLAVGGGAVTDLAGYVAATYLRGVEAVYCPTTLLGAVDAAIGGKTGINLDGKNLVGVFRQPARVVIDIEILQALPIELLRQGLAEALKAGLIADPDLVDLLERDGSDADLTDVVERAVRVKLAIVEEDFTESGRRALLNYGHTIGHAVEVAAGVSHGEAVAIGMVAAGAVAAHTIGFAAAARQRAIIERLGLPTAADFDRLEARALIGLDKKRDMSGVRMVLLEDVGRPVVMTVSEESIDLGLDAAAGAAG